MANEENLTPFPPGVSGNPEGRPKGRRSLSTIIRDMLEEEFDWTLVDPKLAKELSEKYKGKAAWEALVATAFTHALIGNTKAMDFLRKAGYGDKLDVTSGDKPLKAVAIYDLREDANDDRDDAVDGNEDQSEASEPSGSDQEPSV